jgi:hypothetical protein
MSVLSSIAKRKAAAMTGGCALLLGGFATAAVAGAGSADAQACTASIGAACVITGSATLGTGTLTATVPASLSWATVLNGTPQALVDTNATPDGDEGYVVDDATGTAAGWNLTVAATTFTNTTGPGTLPDTGTFSTNGDVGAVGPTATTPPDVACTSGIGDCTLPNDVGVTYPVAITTAAVAPTAFSIYDAGAGTGIGSATIGTFGAITATDPVGWWLTIPSSTLTGVYQSTVTIDVSSGPAGFGT